MRTRIATAAVVIVLLLLAFGLGLGCAGLGRGPQRYEYFASASDDDAWSPKIAAWQRRERADDGEPLGVDPVAEGAGQGVGEGEPSELDWTSSHRDLRSEYFSFRADRKRGVARGLAEWVQSEARSHYVADGPIDHWATLEETLRGDGDDCDGLELLTFHALRDLGFDSHEVYRAIVYRPSDGQHHMVTLWFEDRNDPWVIDPTGAMTTGMPRMSELPSWVPIKVFSDTVEYTVRPRRDLDSAAALASNE